MCYAVTETQGIHMEKVESTKNYEIFKYLEGNRTLNSNHLRKLKKSIEDNNHLNLHPIIVNQNFEVIDGQHRLQCAKDLGLDIYYIKSDKVNDDHLIACNVNQKSFECDNYIDYFAIKEKRDEYIRLKSMMKTTTLKPKALLTLILGTVSTNILDFLKTGKFKFPISENPEKTVDMFLEFLMYVKDKRINPTSMFTNHNFTKSFRWLTRTSGFDLQVFYKKLDLRWFDLKPQRSAEDWYSLLISIYNFKNQNRIDDEYTREK
jgi:hypothetical protein